MFQSQDELHKYLKKNNIITTTLLKGGLIFSPNRNFGTLPTPKKTEYFILREGSRVEVSKIILIWDGNSTPLDFLLANLNFGAVFWRENPNLLLRNPMEWNFHPR